MTDSARPSEKMDHRGISRGGRYCTDSDCKCHDPSYARYYDQPEAPAVARPSKTLGYATVAAVAIRITQYPLAMFATCVLCNRRTDSMSLHRMDPEPQHERVCPLHPAHAPETPTREQLLRFAQTVLAGTSKDGLYNGRSPDELWSEFFPMTDMPSDETVDARKPPLPPREPTAFEDFVDSLPAARWLTGNVPRGTTCARCTGVYDVELPESPGFFGHWCTVKAAAPRELTLHDFGYAPGNYAIKCLDCGQESLGCDKRAARCETCAKQALAENRKGLAANEDV